MFNYMRFRWLLRQNEKARRRAHRRYEKRIAAARAEGVTQDKIEDINSDAMRDDYELDDEVFELHTSYLMGQARRLMITTPDRKNEEMWTRALISGYPHLTKKGIAELRAAIRAERKAQRESFLLWVPGITGILALIVALAAILVGKK